jgi:glycosyltransferase involved in cell wall biosynthesis
MRVAFDHHSPYLLAHGGFQIQIERTLEALNQVGIETFHLKWWDETTLPDVIHFFGKPDTYYLEFARSKGIKTVVSELHGATASRPAWKLAIQGAIIRACRTASPAIARRLGWLSYDFADALVAGTPTEAEITKSVFHAPAARVHVIPNGVEDVFFATASAGRREEWLLFSGTITQRKRALEIARAASLARVPLRIYGKPYSPDDPYYREFLTAVASSGGCVEFRGQIEDRAELAGIYGQAKGFVLPSTMESFSLAALEAVAANCPLLLTDLPWARSTIGDHATYLPDTSQPDALALGLKTFYANPKPPAGYRVLKWPEVAEQLAFLYRSL